MALQDANREANLRARVVIEAGQNMRRAGLYLDSVRDRHARHLERRGEIGRAVVDARQEMRMKIDHHPKLEECEN
jgi:D-serine deaminase-like pyridoxal phosphate-dependent protein